MSLGNHSKIGIPEVLGRLVFQCLVGLINKFRLTTTFFGHALAAHLQIHPQSPWSSGTSCKISNQGADHLTRLKKQDSDGQSVPEKTACFGVKPK